MKNNRGDSYQPKMRYKLQEYKHKPAHKYNCYHTYKHRRQPAPEPYYNDLFPLQPWQYPDSYHDQEPTGL